MADQPGPLTLPLPETLLGQGEHTVDANGSARARPTARATPLQMEAATPVAPDTANGGNGRKAPSRLAGLLPERYEALCLLAQGGFGEVWRVKDRVLRRVLAMKVLRDGLVHSEHMRARFLTEARITAQLQHPGIVAVHDHGVLADGRLWFTMKEVRGRTLRAVIEEVHGAAHADGFVEAPSGWTFRRLLDAFARISQAVAFAHSKGVMHRDLKPDNLMVGEFGEVLVMDWGLARRFDLPPSDPDPDDDSIPGFSSVDMPPEENVPVLLTEDITKYGDVIGTPAYMPPEQALGHRELHGPHSDVYSLGAILYHLLSGRAPYVGTGHGALRQVLSGPPPPLAHVLLLRPPVPEELVVVCERAMQRAIHDRYPGAEHLAREMVAFLEGARRREQALAVLDEARSLEPELASLRAQAAQRREEARALLAEIQPFDEVDKKRGGWALEDEAAALGRQAAVKETEWLQTVHGALILHPDLPEAHAVLADHYRERLSAAELAHRDEDAARFEAQLRAHDRGRHTAFLRGEGALTLVTDPPGAEVRVERYEPRDRRLVPVDMGVRWTTPLHRVPLLRGSYRLRIRAPGRSEVMYPVLVERGAHWDGCAPGEREPSPIVLPKEGELGPEDCYVPAGWCWTGGDPEAVDSLPLQRVWIEAFVMRRFPVTNREYLEFLNDLVVSGREDEALAACPRVQLGMADNGGERLAFGRDEGRRFVLIDDELGRPSQPDWPVMLVDWYGARAFATWLAARCGPPWRLPNELEREKAARGVDGRVCPWGDYLEATFTCTLESSEAQPVRAGVETYPFDESVYGVRGLAGNSRDWCENVWRREGPAVENGRLMLDPENVDATGLRALRGGSWSSPLSLSRSASRFGAHPGLRRLTSGLRVVHSFPARGGVHGR